jgi:ribonuclease HI
MKMGAGTGLLFISPLGVHLCYVIQLHFAASNNVAEYEALVNGLHIAIELGIRRLDVRGDSQLVIDQVMKNSSCHDARMEAYCKEVRCLEDNFHGLELNHIARRYNEVADELEKIASGQTTVPPNIFSRDIYKSSVVLKEASWPAPETNVPLAGEPDAMQIDREQGGATPASDWRTTYLEFILRGELPLGKAEAWCLAQRAKTFVLLEEEKELYQCSPSGML